MAIMKISTYIILGYNWSKILEENCLTVKTCQVTDYRTHQRSVVCFDCLIYNHMVRYIGTNCYCLTEGIFLLLQNPLDHQWTVSCHLLRGHVRSYYVIHVPRAKSETPWCVMVLLHHQLCQIYFSVLENTRNTWKIFGWYWAIF